MTHHYEDTATPDLFADNPADVAAPPAPPAPPAPTVTAASTGVPKHFLHYARLRST